MMLLDGHVHFHEVFLLERFFDSAARNFGHAGRALGLQDGGPGVLLLTECAGADAFDTWWSLAATPVGGVSFARTREPQSLIARREAGPPLVLIAGRQLVTAEKLEVLALGVREQLEDGRELGATLESVRRAGGLPVLPWGVGKWIGRRGRLVREALARGERLLFLGDNGGRWRRLPRPALLDEGERCGVPVLPGSDPFPLAGQERRVGAFGFALPVALDLHEPARRIREALLERPRIEPYGEPARLGSFLSMQLALRLRRRRLPTSR